MPFKPILNTSINKYAYEINKNVHGKNPEIHINVYGLIHVNMNELIYS